MGTVRRSIRSVFLSVLSAALILGYAVAGSAHPGGTDSRGGHHCWTNCDRWGERYGEWHCHSGCGGGGGDGGGSYTPPKPRDTTPPAKPSVKGATVKGSRLRILVVAERNSTLNFWLRGRLKETVKATGSKQRVDLTLADGRHEIKIVAKDAAGNKSRPKYVERKIDTRAPNDPWISVEPGTPSNTETEFTIGGEPRSEFTFRVAQGSSVLVTRTGRLPGSGQYVIGLELEEGSYRSSVYLIDEAGNRSNKTIEEFEIGSLEPPAPGPQDTYSSVATPIDDATSVADRSEESSNTEAILFLALIGGGAWLARKRIGSWVAKLRGGTA